MPNTSSAKKRLRQNVVRRERNRAVKSAVKTQIKKVLSAIDDGNIELAETEYRTAAKQIDRSGAHRVIHKNAAARKKSKLQKVIKAAKS